MNCYTGVPCFEYSMEFPSDKAAVDYAKNVLEQMGPTRWLMALQVYDPDVILIAELRQQMFVTEDEGVAESAEVIRERERDRLCQ